MRHSAGNGAPPKTIVGAVVMLSGWAGDQQLTVPGERGAPWPMATLLETPPPPVPMPTW